MKNLGDLRLAIWGRAKEGHLGDRKLTAFNFKAIWNWALLELVLLLLLLLSFSFAFSSFNLIFSRFLSSTEPNKQKERKLGNIKVEETAGLRRIVGQGSQLEAEGFATCVCCELWHLCKLSSYQISLLPPLYILGVGTTEKKKIYSISFFSIQFIVQRISWEWDLEFVNFE